MARRIWSDLLAQHGHPPAVFRRCDAHDCWPHSALGSAGIPVAMLLEKRDVRSRHTSTCIARHARGTRRREALVLAANLLTTHHAR